MKQEQRQNFINEYELALETTPVSVRTFLWSDAYKNLVTSFAKKFNLPEEKKATLDTLIFESIIGVAEEEDTERQLASLGLPEAAKAELIDYITSFIIKPTIQNAENTIQSEPETIPTTEALSPSQFLASIQERLSQSSTIAPTKRDYSVEKPIDVSSISKPLTPDPYREMPEK